MEDGDDDFGDLYADVEVEANSAMNVAPQISQLQFVIDETGKRNSVLEASSDKEDRVSVGVDGYEDDDDDDDDLNIVLNSDDDSIRHGEGFTAARTNTNLRSGELEDEDDANFGPEEFVGGKGVGNSHSQYKYLRSQSATSASDLKGSGCGAADYLSREDNGYPQRMGSRSMGGPQHGQRFSLPRYRSILDVNIDAFEQKPWKHLGADITDYFNFGLNEDSWKLYCNQVDEYRHRGPMSSGSPASEPGQSMERKGWAIQVEDSLVERQSSMDVRRQLDRDSDVIQITILDSEDHCSGSAKEVSDNLHSSVPEASNHADDDGTDHLSFSSASEDESFEQEMDIYAPNRSSNRRSSSKPVTQGSENHETHLISESIRTSDNTKERTGDDTCTTDPSILAAESSEAEKSHKSFEDGPKPYKRRTFTELKQSVQPRRLTDKRKPSDHRYHSRCISPVYNNRIWRESKPIPHHENDDITFSRRREEKGKPSERRYHARRHGNPVYNHGIHRRNERMHPFDPYNEEYISYSREHEPALDYYHGERFSGYEDWDTLANGYERFGPKMGRPVYRSSEEDYYGDRRDWYHDERELAVENVDDEFFYEREYCDEINGRRERDDFEGGYVKDVPYTRWEFRCSGRNKRDEDSCEESNINNARWVDHTKPTSRKYRGQLTESFGCSDYMIDIDDHVDMGRTRQQHWGDDVEELIYDPYVEGRKCNKFERSSNVIPEKRFHRRRRDSVYSREAIDESLNVEWVFNGGVDSNGKGCGYKQKREVISGKSYGESGRKILPRCRNSLDSRLVKPFKKHVATKPINEKMDIEEGHTGPTKDKNRKTGVDNTRILEARAKMEKRRARFNEQQITTTKNDSGSTTKVTVEETGSNKAQRPPRKRRWGGGGS